MKQIIEDRFIEILLFIAALAFLAKGNEKAAGGLLIGVIFVAAGKAIIKTFF